MNQPVSSLARIPIQPEPPQTPIWLSFLRISFFLWIRERVREGWKNYSQALTCLSDGTSIRLRLSTSPSLTKHNGLDIVERA